MPVVDAMLFLPSALNVISERYPLAVLASGGEAAVSEGGGGAVTGKILSVICLNMKL